MAEPHLGVETFPIFLPHKKTIQTRRPALYLHGVREFPVKDIATILTEPLMSKTIGGGYFIEDYREIPICAVLRTARLFEFNLKLLIATLLLPGFDQIAEPRELRLEAQFDSADGPVTLLADDDLSLAMQA